MGLTMLTQTMAGGLILTSSCIYAMKLCLFQAIRSACQGSGSNTAGVAPNSVGTKEMHYVLRVLGPAACRCPDLFVEVVTSSLRIQLPPPGPPGRKGK